MLLVLQHPEVAYRSCEDCQKFIYDHETGEKRENKETGEGVPRIEGTALPCEGKGCPMGTPDKRRALTPNNLLAWVHYQECKAVGDFPKDATVKRNAGLIAAAERLATRAMQCEQLQTSKQTNRLMLSYLKALSS